MAQAKRLHRGAATPSPSPSAEKERIAVLRTTVTKHQPDFARGIAVIGAHGEKDSASFSTRMLSRPVMMANTPCGMAIKYARLHGTSIMIIGTNHDTI